MWSPSYSVPCLSTSSVRVSHGFPCFGVPGQDPPLRFRQDRAIHSRRRWREESNSAVLCAERTWIRRGCQRRDRRTISRRELRFWQQPVHFRVSNQPCQDPTIAAEPPRFSAVAPARLCAAFQFSWIQLPGTVVHSHNVNITRSESINESITAKKNLSKVRIVHLWNNSA